MATTVTLTANVPTDLADMLGLTAGAGRQTNAVLNLRDGDAVNLVHQGLARFGSAATDAAQGGTQGKRPLLRGTATLDFPSIAAAASATLTIAVPGADVGDPVVVGVPAALNAGLAVLGFVSAAGVVTVRLTNVTAGAIDPASGSWTAAVLD